VGAPAVHRQLRAWAEHLGVETTAPAEPEPLPARRRPRALPLVAAYLALEGGVLALMGLLILYALVAGEAVTPEAGIATNAGIVGLVFMAAGCVGIAAGYGVWRRRRWAWIVALVVTGIAVLQAVVALASEGIGGILSYGLVAAAISILAFFYLTRADVAAEFGRRRRPRGRRWRDRLRRERAHPPASSGRA
jgi:hypothetical protein